MFENLEVFHLNKATKYGLIVRRWSCGKSFTLEYSIWFFKRATTKFFTVWIDYFNLHESSYHNLYECSYLILQQINQEWFFLPISRPGITQFIKQASGIYGINFPSLISVSEIDSWWGITDIVLCVLQCWQIN